MAFFSAPASLSLAAVLLFSGCGDKAGRVASEAPDATPPGVSTPLPAPRATPVAARPRIVCLGDSLTAGFGLDRKDSYPALLQKRLDEAGYVYEVVNAGVSGDTSAGGLRRMTKALEGDVRVVILELGANDGLRGQPPAEMKKNLTAMVRLAKARDVKVLLAGMEALPNLGDEYRNQFRTAFTEVSRQEGVALIPFFLDNVAGHLELNQSDGVHPNEEGAKIVADLVYDHVKPLLEKR